MNQTEHLAKIRAKCVGLVAKYPPCESTAGWKSTIAAIDGIPNVTPISDMKSRTPEAEAIIAAWPEELL